MKNLLCFALSALTLAAPLPAWAGGCYRSSYSYTPYVAPTYVQPIAVATYFTVPLYSVGYVAPVVATPAALPVAATATTTAGAAVTTVPAESSCEARAKALEARLVTLEKLLAAPASPPPQTRTAPESASSPAPAGASRSPASGDVILQNKCAACHSSKDAQAKGKNFVLFEGAAYLNVRPLSEKEKLKIIGQVNSARMPPADNKEGIPPLTDQEVADVIGYLEAVPTAAEAKP